MGETHKLELRARRKAPSDYVAHMMMVGERVEEAHDCMRRIPDPDARFKGFSLLSWPGTLAEKFIDYPKDRLEVRLGPPSAAMISRTDEVIDWMVWLAKSDRVAARIIWLSCGRRFRTSKVARIVGMHRTTVNAVRTSALIAIVDQFIMKRAA